MLYFIMELLFKTKCYFCLGFIIWKNINDKNYEPLKSQYVDAAKSLIAAVDEDDTGKTTLCYQMNIEIWKVDIDLSFQHSQLYQHLS